MGPRTVSLSSGTVCVHRLTFDLHSAAFCCSFLKCPREGAVGQDERQDVTFDN